MAQSITDACNAALQKVGASRILSLADDSKEARECAVAFAGNRRAELRKHIWGFAKKMAELAPDAVAPPFGYAYAFTLPTDCLRIILPNDSALDWKVVGRKIYTNLAQSPAGVTGSPALGLTYIRDVEDVTQWDSLFYDAFCNALALDICEPLTQSNQKKAGITADYKEVIQAARMADAIETPPEEGPDDSLWLVRM